MVFSFMGPQHGRILHAHFDGEMLVIRQSILHNFQRKESAPVDLFLQCMVNTSVEVTHVTGLLLQRDILVVRELLETVTSCDLGL